MVVVFAGQHLHPSRLELSHLLHCGGGKSREILENRQKVTRLKTDEKGLIVNDKCILTYCYEVIIRVRIQVRPKLLILYSERMRFK